MIRTENTTTGSPHTYSEIIKEDLQKSGDELSKTLKSKQDELGHELKDKAESAMSSAADEIEDLSSAAEAAAQALHDHNHERLSAYVSDMAEHIGTIAENIRYKSVDDLVADAKHMARKNPTLFIVGGIALGLGIARLAKLSHKSSEQRQSSTYDLSSPSQSSIAGPYVPAPSNLTGYEPEDLSGSFNARREELNASDAFNLNQPSTSDTPQRDQTQAYQNAARTGATSCDIAKSSTPLKNS